MKDGLPTNYLLFLRLINFFRIAIIAKWQVTIRPQIGLDLITYVAMVNIESLAFRPPFTYERLARVIANSWNEIVCHVKKHTLLQSYSVSRIHPRVIPDSQAIFQMNFSNWMNDPSPEPAILIGKQYVVKCDTSTCFPSIYTHSLPWAIMGRDRAKQDRELRPDNWANKIDKLLQKVSDCETHGLLIGPHSSNVVSELILTVIDANLYNKGYRFIRNIDDYSCYVASQQEGEGFILSLQEELSKFRLRLNQKKTEVL